jgi:hypothetical protein
MISTLRKTALAVVFLAGTAGFASAQTSLGAGAGATGGAGTSVGAGASVGTGTSGSANIAAQPSK